MAITPTPAHYEGFVYGAVDSHTYGVVISDTNAYDSAGRAVEMITIPGRNGAYAMDHKRYENIEVTYHCSIPATDPADFISAISDLRNALGALAGYNRLTDDFNDNEYRMAVLKGGVGVTNINPQAGTFDVVFDCKPQRYLTSGETPIPGTSSLTVTNPTLYDAAPLIKAVGYGDITINGEAVTIADDPIGDVRIADIQAENLTIAADGASTSGAVTIYPNYTPLSPGDTVTIGASTWADGQTAAVFTLPFGSYSNINSITYTTDGGLNARILTGQYASVSIPTLTYAAGAATNLETETIDFTVNTTNGTSVFRAVVGWQVLPHPGVFEVGFTVTMTRTSYTGTPKSLAGLLGNIRTAPFIGYVSAPATTESIYIDLDIGEAYIILNGDAVSYNGNVSIPAALPVLAPGSNIITAGAHITSYEITPRWWQL